MTPLDADIIIASVFTKWPPRARVMLATLVSLGTPEELADPQASTPAHTVGEENPPVHGVKVSTPASGLPERVRAAVLAAWRIVARVAGVPMAPPQGRA